MAGDSSKGVFDLVRNTNQAFSIMSHQIPQLQGIVGAITDINVAYPIKANNFAGVRAGNAACEIYLTATGINILHDNLLSRGIVVHIQFVLVAAILGTPISASVDNFILFAGGDHIIADRATIISIIDFGNATCSCSIGDIGIVIPKATLNDAININIRSIDINIAACNITARSLRIIREGSIELLNIMLAIA